MTYIYERNPDTGEVFKREKGNYNKRELIKQNNMEMISLYLIMELKEKEI